ncbi:hypothetical protein RIF29_30125 [Crotalaria pallida]|uniref:SNF2 N-terminal domain-containing protein n=1 Tax=Crotalaria pallida TaxID=3830 RepID=A0AAN9EHW4_CROPI
MYPHQREGFKFIWTNLARTIDNEKLKNDDHYGAGGCIISNDPKTGKTRLTIPFLQTYLDVFSHYREIIVAPSCLLLTWEEEIRKWNIGVPFHNLKSLELLGKLKSMLMPSTKLIGVGIQQRNIVKLYTWFKEKSILGISYNLFEKHVGGESKADVNIRKMMEDTESRIMGKFLRDISDLLVLDEGQTPRNHYCLIWKAFSEIQTHKRIIHLGTPF